MEERKLSCLAIVGSPNGSGTFRTRRMRFKYLQIYIHYSGKYLVEGMMCEKNEAVER